MKVIIEQALKDLMQNWGHSEVAFVVDYPTDKHTEADYFSNIAMVLAPKRGAAPRVIAEEIATHLKTLGIPELASVEVAGPGFINFILTRDQFTKILTTVIQNESEWGRNSSYKGEVVLVEYTSPNLFKPLHIGNLVGNIIGESLTRLFEYSGATVKRVNYPSDIGLTVAKAVWGLTQTNGDAMNINALGEAYRYGNEKYETDEVAKNEIIEVNQALYARSNHGLNELRDQGVFTSKFRLDSICASLGTKFDTAIFESDAAPKGIEIVKANTPGVFVESEGAVVYEGEKVGLHTRVFLNSKGLPTYEAKDLGNFAKKQELFPDWNTSIIVTGNEQTEYFKVLYAAIREVFNIPLEKSLEHIPTGFLTLTTGKMSSRKGNVLSGEQLLEELEQEAMKRGSSMDRDYEQDIPLATKVAGAALKYQILRSAVGSNMVFDKQKALSFEGDSGPYLQYTYARIQSVLEKAKIAGVQPKLEHPSPTAYEVEKLISRFPGIVSSALFERAPHKVTTYLTELAGAFNTFYAHEKIADVSDEYAPYKAAVAKAVAITLKNGLWTLGIKAPERM